MVAKVGGHRSWNDWGELHDDGWPTLEKGAMVKERVHIPDALTAEDSLPG